MERRAYQRISTDIKARFFCNDNVYNATVTNMSENGMYLEMDKVMFPFDSVLDIFLLIKEAFIKVPVKVRRLRKRETVFDAMGVQIIEPVPEYINLITRLKLEPYPAS